MAILSRTKGFPPTGANWRASARPYWAGSVWQWEGWIARNHDVMGNLVRVDYANGRAPSTLAYDLGGRKTSMDDVDLGQWR